ncbi:MAG: hypothetical protein M0Q92_14925 [Methanoregula sp.]|jgi:predicted ABC-class ATPase|nr:hypothetical protein [Methanoregula sp.]
MQRERMGDTTIVFAASAMNTLIALADRIMVFDWHVASAIDPVVFCRMFAGSLRKAASGIERYRKGHPG